MVQVLRVVKGKGNPREYPVNRRIRVIVTAGDTSRSARAAAIVRGQVYRAIKEGDPKIPCLYISTGPDRITMSKPNHTPIPCGGHGAIAGIGPITMPSLRRAAEAPAAPCRKRGAALIERRISRTVIFIDLIGQSDYNN